MHIDWDSGFKVKFERLFRRAEDNFNLRGVLALDASSPKPLRTRVVVFASPSKLTPVGDRLGLFAAGRRSATRGTRHTPVGATARR